MAWKSVYYLGYLEGPLSLAADITAKAGVVNEPV